MTMTSMRPEPGRRRRSIQTRLLWLVGLGVLSALAIFGITSWIGIAQATDALAADRQVLAQSVASHIDYLVRGDLEVLQGLSGTAPAPEGGGQALPDSPSLRSAYLRAHLLERVFLLGVDGRTIDGEPPVAGGRAPSVPVADVHTAVESGKPVVTGALASSGGSLYLLVPVRDWTGKVTSLAAGEVVAHSGRLAAVFDSFDLLQGGSLDLVDTAGVTVASTDRARTSTSVEALAPVVSHLKAHEPWFGTDDPTARVIALAPLRTAPWGVVARQAQSDAFARTLFYRRLMLWVAPLVLALTLVLAWGGARSVLRPVALLTESAEGIAYGNLEQPIPPLGADEIGRLGRSFEQMRLALKVSMDHVEQANAVLERRVHERTQELERLNVRLQEKEAWREELLRKVISAQEDERKRLARELHDETSQTLSALAMKIETALSGWPTDAGRERLSEAKTLIVRMIEELHRLIFDLRPSVLDDLGLLSAIRWYAERHLEPRGMSVRCEFSGFARRLKPELETALFRIVQESITNIAKHSGAETVLIQCLERDDGVSIEIEDDGHGFSPENLPPPAARERGFGLMGMQERVELFGGTFEIDSSPGSGTRVVVSVPLV